MNTVAVEPVAGGVAAPQGFRAAGVACGIKPSGGPDLALVVAEIPATAAGVFTTNLAKAAPVLVSQEQLARAGGQAGAVVINSGCANACTGAGGISDARTMAAFAAEALGCAPAGVLVASTGVIGVALDMTKVRRGIDAAVRQASRTGGPAAARAIMTTDPFPKSRAVTARCGAGSFRVGGMAKGSGMIEPQMATMLAVVTTDVAIDATLLQGALRSVVADTFNAITVDGECSTNDCVFLLASGAGDVRIEERELPSFVEALRAVCEPLAIDIVRGGEGATRLITVRVTGAASDEDARRAARAIANSPLVKTAVHGGDPNWGRLVAVAGRSGAAFVLDEASVRIGPIELFAHGVPHDERAADARSYLQQPEVELEVDLGTGGAGRRRMWTCDLSAEYIRINAEYRT